MKVAKIYKNGEAIPFRTTIEAVSGDLQTRLKAIIKWLSDKELLLNANIQEKLNIQWPILNLPDNALGFVTLDSVEGLRDIVEFIIASTSLEYSLKEEEDTKLKVYNSKDIAVKGVLDTIALNDRQSLNDLLNEVEELMGRYLRVSPKEINLPSNASEATIIVEAPDTLMWKVTETK